MPDTAERLLARSERDQTTGCLRWTGALTHKGYGLMSVDNHVQQVHRIAYAVWVGPIPESLEIDHVHERGCRYRDCIEPTHLEPVTHGENVRRAARARRALTGADHVA